MAGELCYSIVSMFMGIEDFIENWFESHREEGSEKERLVRTQHNQLALDRVVSPRKALEERIPLTYSGTIDHVTSGPESIKGMDG